MRPREMTTDAGRTWPVRSVAVLAAALAVISIGVSGAVFTDTDDVTVSAISTGTLDLTLGSTTMDFSLTNMVPGDTSGIQQLAVSNSTQDLRYALTSTTSEDALAAQLDLSIWLESAEDTVDSTCNDATPTSFLYEDGVIGSVAGTAVLGDPAQGAQAGDRPLVNGASEILCFDVDLPLAADDTAQGITTTVTFTFDSEQTANN